MVSGTRPSFASSQTTGSQSSGLRSAAERLKNTGTLGWKEGTGRKRTRRTPEAAEAARQLFADNKTANCGELRNALDTTRIAARGIISGDIGRKPLRQVTAQRVNPVNAAKRLAGCHLWGSQFRSGDLEAGWGILYGREVVPTRLFFQAGTGTL